MTGPSAETLLMYRAAKNGETTAGYLGLICHVESIAASMPDGWHKNALESAARAGRQDIDKIADKYRVM